VFKGLNFGSLFWLYSISPSCSQSF